MLTGFLLHFCEQTAVYIVINYGCWFYRFFICYHGYEFVRSQPLHLAPLSLQQRTLNWRFVIAVGIMIIITTPLVTILLAEVKQTFNHDNLQREHLLAFLMWCDQLFQDYAVQQKTSSSPCCTADKFFHHKGRFCFPYTFTVHTGCLIITFLSGFVKLKNNPRLSELSQLYNHRWSPIIEDQ